jgi:hypothetical protein
MLRTHIANNFGIMYSRKRISQNSFPNLIYIFPKSFMIFYSVRNYKIPKGIMITRFEPRLPRMYVNMKKYITAHTGFELETPASFSSILSLDHQGKIL